MQQNATQVILNKVMEVIDRNEPYDKIFKGDSDSLIKILEELAYERIPTFGDYINAYVYENNETLKVKYSAPDEVPVDEIWKYIKDSFKINGMEGRGDLYSDKISLSSKKNILIKSGSDIDKKRSRQKFISVARKDIFLFAFGLGLEPDDVSRLLCNALLTYDFNPKDYREIIYYWCLKKNNKLSDISPYEKMIELMKFYDKCDPQDEKKSEYHTSVLNDRMRALNSEKEVMDYLAGLKGFKAEILALKGITESFDNTVKLLKESLGYPYYDTHIKKYRDIGLEDLVNEVNLERKDIYLNYIKNNNHKPNNGLIKESVLGKLFEGFKFSKKSFEHRMSTKNTAVSRTSASRRELLVNSFIIFCNNNAENEDWTESIENRYPDFDEYAGQILERCNMTSYSVYNGPGLYLKNPFELFLAVCLLQTDPYEYFMASWESAEQYNEKQN